MRELLYQAYLRYPRAFYDRHATGQVVSRATNDLYPIRYFIGWGMTQGVQSLMMIVGIAVVLFLVNVKLAAIALVAMPAVVLLAFAFARKVMPISRQVQQLKADVTEAADEAVVGIEMVQAFGREDDVQARFAEKAGAVRDGVLRQARVEAAFLPGLLFLPTLSIGAVVLFGGRDVIGGTLTYGEFFLFYQLLLQLVWPLEALGWILSLAQRATASASRSFAWLEGIETIPEPTEPTSLPAGALDVRFEGVHFSYGTGSEVLSGVDLTSRRARSSRSAGRPARARRRSSTCCRASTTRPTAACSSAASTCATSRSRSCARSRDRHAAPDSLLDPAPRQPDRRTARRALGRGPRRLRRRRRRAVRRRAARRLRHADRRARRQPLRRPAPARRARPRARRRRAHHRARRPDVGRRHADRAAPRRRPPPRARRPHGADRDAAALDRAGRRPRGRARRRRHRRDGHAATSCSPRRRLRSLFGEEVSAARARPHDRPDAARPLPARPARCASRARGRRRLRGGGARHRARSSCRTRSTTACGATTAAGSTRDVLVYLGINALAWVLQTTLVRGLARIGQDLVLALRETSSTT